MSDAEQRSPIKHIEHLGYGEETAEEIMEHVKGDRHDVIMSFSDKSVHLVEWLEEEA